jgi:hypothetical protein
MKIGLCVSVAQAHEVVGSGAKFVEEHIRAWSRPGLQHPQRFPSNSSYSSA